MEKFFMKKVDNFRNSLETLCKVPDADYQNDKLILAGCVNTFCMTFELAWKAMKEILKEQGVPDAVTGSPKQILELAFHFGMIQDEKMWLMMLRVRNDETHYYNEEAAKQVCFDSEKYIEIFQELNGKMKEMGY